jgi:hypothetical protein
LVNVFVRERLRQWRHQLVLDGDFMALSVTNPQEFSRELHSRWKVFKDRAKVPEARYRSFLNPDKSGFFFATEICNDEEVRRQVIRAQADMRVEYQIAYAEQKTAPTGGGLSLHDSTYYLTWLSTATFAFAVLTAFSLAFVVGFPSWFPVSRNWDIAIGWVAIGLGILSVGARALRTGLTSPDEELSFSQYLGTLRVTQGLFTHFEQEVDKDRRDTEEWTELRNVETAAIEELRRYLRMKDASRYIF